MSMRNMHRTAALESHGGRHGSSPRNWRAAVPQVKGSTAKLRENSDGSPYVTDNSNYIVDLYFKGELRAKTNMEQINFRNFVP